MTENVPEIKKESSLLELANLQTFCQSLMKTKHYAKMGEEGIFAILSKAKAVGIDPFEALNGAFFYVQGKVGMSTETMACLTRQAGHSVTKDPKSTATCCILNGKRKDNGDTWQISFSIDDAKKAGIYNERGPWGKYPAIMCYNRAMSTLFRQLFPDLSRGAGYTMEELQEIKPNKILEKADVEEIPPEPLTNDQIQEILSLIGDDTEFQDTLLTRLKRAFNCDGWTTVPKDQYKAIVNVIGKHNLERIEKEMEVREVVMEEENDSIR